MPDSMPPANDPPNPGPILQALNAYQISAALRGAIELDLFKAIGEGFASPTAIATRIRATERGVRILCDFLTIHGFLEKDAGTYRLAPVSAAFLDPRSAAYHGGIVRFLHHPSLARAFEDVAGLVRRGGTLLEEGGTVAPDADEWVDFAKSMIPMMAPAAEYIAEVATRERTGRLRVLDVAAGHGAFGIAIARRHAGAEIVALDWPAVLDVAREHAVAAGVSDRYLVLAGDAFTVDYGRDFDVVLLTNFLHHFDPEACERILRKTRAALAPGGVAITLEFVPNEDRISPPVAASFALTMLATTPAGDAYTFAELESLCRGAGFARSELHAVPRSPEHIVVSWV
jgi:SAM-dependent methyltransferase